MSLYSPEVAALVGQLHGALVADAELERLAAQGDADAQTAALLLSFGLWQSGAETWDEFTRRAATTFSRAVASGTVRKLFRYEGDERAAREAHALFLALLDAWADAGDEAALAAIAALGDFLPIETQRHAAAIRLSWKAPAPTLEPFDLELTSITPAPLSRWCRVRLWLGDRCRGLGFWLTDRLCDLADAIERGC